MAILPTIRQTISATGALLLGACLGLPAAAQSTPSPLPPSFTPPAPSSEAPGPFNAGSPSPDPEQSHMLHKMVKERSVLRQQLIVHDTDRLLELAKQLKEDVDKSRQDQLSVSVVNTASEIEKLAKTVKEKMRDGQ